MTKEEYIEIAQDLARWNDRETIRRIEAGELEPPQVIARRREKGAEGTLFDQAEPLRMPKGTPRMHQER
jgi:hypothetical protein